MGKNEVFNIDDELREDPWSEIRWMRRCIFGSIALYFGSFIVLNIFVGRGRDEPFIVMWAITLGIILFVSFRFQQLKCPVCKKSFAQNRRLPHYTHCGYCKSKSGADIPPSDEQSAV